MSRDVQSHTLAVPSQCTTDSMEAPSGCENGLCHPTRCAPTQCCHTRAVLHGPHLGCSSVPDVVHNHSLSAEHAQMRIHSAMPFQGEHRCIDIAVIATACLPVATGDAATWCATLHLPPPTHAHGR